jgi:hypothetical protein
MIQRTEPWNVQTEHFRNSARAALQKGIKDNSVFQKFDRTILTERTCVTQVKEMHMWQ